jgi:hypothetical protein
MSFAPLLTQSLNGFAVVDDAGRYVWVSTSMCNLLHVDKDTLLGCALLRRDALALLVFAMHPPWRALRAMRRRARARARSRRLARCAGAVVDA